MHFSKINLSSTTAALLISLISASPIQFSDLASITNIHHSQETGTSASRIPHPTEPLASNSEFATAPSNGVKHAPHHSLPYGSGSVNNIVVETAALPTATTLPTINPIEPSATESDDQQIDEVTLKRATKGGSKTSGDGNSSASGGGSKRDASADSGESVAKGNVNGGSSGSARKGGAKKERDMKEERATKGGSKTAGSGTSSAGGGGAKKERTTKGGSKTAGSGASNAGAGGE